MPFPDQAAAIPPEEKKLSHDAWPAAMWDFATPRSREIWCSLAKQAQGAAEQDWVYLFESERRAILPVLNDFAYIRDHANKTHRAQIAERERIGMEDRRATPVVRATP